MRYFEQDRRHAEDDKPGRRFAELDSVPADRHA